MTQQLRPTGPLPEVDPRGVSTGLPRMLQALDAAALPGVALYSLVVMCAQAQGPCTRDILRQLVVPPLFEEVLDPTLDALLAADLVAWVEEDEDGGAA